MSGWRLNFALRTLASSRLIYRLLTYDLLFLVFVVTADESAVLSLSQSEDECVDVAECVIELKWDYIDDSMTDRVRR